MAKLLSVKDRILLGLAFWGDVFDEVRLLGGVVPLTYKQVYGWVPPRYRRTNFYQTISALFKTDNIEKRGENGKMYLVLTSRGVRTVRRKFPLLRFAQAKWDGLFTQVTFDIREINRNTRDVFRNKLLSLGFGRLQKSVYLTPHNIAEDMAEVIESHHLEEVVKVFRSKLVLGDPQVLAEKVWKISRLNEKYRNLLKELEKGKVLTGEEREKWIRTMNSKFLSILITDPFLPKQLLPDNWLGEKVRNLIKSLQ